MRTGSVGLALSAIAALALCSCATTPEQASEPVADTAAERAATAAQAERRTPEIGAVGNQDSAESTDGDLANISLGSGTFVQTARSGRANAYATEDGVTLNFEQADLHEFLRVVFETILQENYLIDPLIRGSVTLHTTRPVTREAVLPIIETVLDGNDAALVRDEGVFKIVPMASAETLAGAPVVGRNASNAAAGYGIQVVPLEHVSAAEIENIIRPFVPQGSALRVDETRNVLILAGPRYRIDELLATIRTFDVDWLRGMSFAMVRLQYADAATLISELEAVINGQGSTPLSGIVRLLPIERLNAVLVIAHRPDHIAEMQRLIEQFDWGVEGSSGKRLYVYELENGKAENIANSLQVVFGRAGADTNLNGGTGSLASDVFRSAEELSDPPPEPGASLNANSTTISDGFLAESQGEIKIIADTDNNSILILANPQDYRAIEAAIRRLDIAPRQVLIEATIAEVTLSGTLDYGVRWFLETSTGERGINAPVPTSATGAGLALAFFDDNSDLSAFFDLLATESSVKFLSTPQVMVLDNQTANIRVGDQIPVTTRSSQSTTNPDAPIVTEVQFRDTGTLLTVTPRINAGGQVTMEISQEVSLPGTEPAIGGGGNVSIAQRTINSSVIVHSGQTVVLGGLILENRNEGKSGIPGLMNIPVLGKLFSTNSTDEFRTELIVTVTPTVIENQRAMQQVTDELRTRMQKATQYETLVNQANSGQ